MLLTVSHPAVIEIVNSIVIMIIIVIITIMIVTCYSYEKIRTRLSQESDCRGTSSDNEPETLGPKP